MKLRLNSLPIVLVLLTGSTLAPAQSTAAGQPNNSPAPTYEGYTLVWQDEFTQDGPPNPDFWSHERGFVRNEELQWYQPANATCSNGVLTITGKMETVVNPHHDPNSQNWRQSRPMAKYTASSIKTEGKKAFKYGRFEIRAKIPTAGGSWPAIWTLGTSMEWPSCGEIDLMEFYHIKGVPTILANTAWGTERRWQAHWDSRTVPISHFLIHDPDWTKNFHIWRMDWDEQFIRLYLDGELLNETNLDSTFNAASGQHKNPFRQPHYLLLNLAIGGINGGQPDNGAFPLAYVIDYVRVYQRNVSSENNSVVK